MATVPAPVSFAEYLETEYEPDVEFVDGVLEDRNAGKRKHSKTQAWLAGWLLAKHSRHEYQVLTKQRVQTSRTRVRMPDVCLVPADDKDEVTKRPPALWIEVLSPDDRWIRIQSKLEDVRRFGVGTIWIIDPYSKQAWISTPEQPTVRVEDGKLRCANPALELELSEVLPQE